MVKVLKRETRSVVASFAAHIDEVSLAWVIASLCGMYSTEKKEI